MLQFFKGSLLFVFLYKTKASDFRTSACEEGVNIFEVLKLPDTFESTANFGLKSSRRIMEALRFAESVGVKPVKPKEMKKRSISHPLVKHNIFNCQSSGNINHQNRNIIEHMPIIRKLSSKKSLAPLGMLNDYRLSSGLVTSHQGKEQKLKLGLDFSDAINSEKQFVHSIFSRKTLLQPTVEHKKNISNASKLGRKIIRFTSSPDYLHVVPFFEKKTKKKPRVAPFPYEMGGPMDPDAVVSEAPKYLRKSTSVPSFPEMSQKQYTPHGCRYPVSPEE